MNHVFYSGAALRLGVFLGVLAAMVLWETASHRRLPRPGRWRRRLCNISLGAINAACTRALVILAPAGAAVLAGHHHWGLFNSVHVSAWVSYPVSLALLDLAIYAQHVAFHKFAPLWRLHRVHHTDEDLDATTGVRFHAIEIALSLAIKSGVVLLLGAPVEAVLAFEILLNATSLFNHGNVKIRPSVDFVLRCFVVTPDMHRVHHSVERSETDSNFGFNLPWWDRIFGTYRAQPAAGHEQMEIGLREFRGDRTGDPIWLLYNPFLDK